MIVLLPHRVLPSEILKSLISLAHKETCSGMVKTKNLRYQKLPHRKLKWMLTV